MISAPGERPYRVTFPNAVAFQAQGAPGFKIFYA
jgi:hypothetical protein